MSKLSRSKRFPAHRVEPLNGPSKVGRLPSSTNAPAHVQIAAACRPVVISGLSVGHHHFETGGRPVVRGSVYVRGSFPHRCRPRLPGGDQWRRRSPPAGGHISAGFGTGGRVVHDHPGTRIAVELKAAGPFGFFFQLRWCARPPAGWWPRVCCCCWVNC